jgi:5-carboxymethyl-2-hydroxymuconate isomerase
MPHCIIAHSQSLDSNHLMALVYQGARASALFASDGSDIKVRALPYNQYLVGGHRDSFVHVTLRILAGRSGALKDALSSHVLTALQPFSATGCAVSVEVVDIDPGSYKKHPTPMQGVIHE